MFFSAGIKKIILALLSFYQASSTWRQPCCRFVPSCSQYSREAIERFGIIQGAILSIKRIGRCHPFGKYGFDPVDPRIEK